jgi:hypothetical protein
MRNKSSFTCPMVGSVFCIFSMFLAQFVPSDLKSTVGFIFGVLFAAFIVWYYTKE